MENPSIINDRGVELLKEGKLSDALEIFKKLIKKFPRDPIYWNNLGFAQFLLDRNEVSLQSVNRALLFNPHFLNALQNKGQILIKMGKSDQAIDVLNTAIKIDPLSKDNYIVLAMAFRKQKRHLEAINCYNFILERDPEHADSWNNLSNSLRELRRYCESYKAIKKAIQLKPESFEVWNNYSALVRKFGCYEEGLRAVEKSLSFNSKSANSWINKGNVLRERGQSANAIECYDKAIEIDRESFIAWSNKGSALHDLGRNNEAIDCFDRSIKINPLFSDGIANRGIGYLTEGKIDLALELMEQALEVESNNPNNWNNMAICLLNLGRHEEALVAVNKALAIDPKFPEAWLNKGYLMALVEKTHEEKTDEIFISYSIEDETIANEICANIEKSGIKCWIAPRDIMPGKIWIDEIPQAIERCKLLLAIVSHSSNESQNVLRELGIADNKKKTIVPVRIEKFTPQKGMGFIVNMLQYFDVFEKDTCEYMPILIAKLNQILQN